MYMTALSKNQKETLLTLSKEYRNGGSYHPIDAYNSNTIHSLEKRKLVYFYRYHLFLHGAVALTSEGQKVVTQLKEESQNKTN